MAALWLIQAYKEGTALDVVTLGESMVLFTPQAVGSMTYASTFTKTIGGAESNVAIALSRLGHNVGWISLLGRDDFGLYLRNTIRGEGVDTSHVHFVNTHPTAVFFKERKASGEPSVFYYRKNSAASTIAPSHLNEDYIAKAKYLHLTGITPALSDSCLAAIHHSIDIAKKHGVKVVFDPNIRLKLWSKEKAVPVLKEIAQRCDIVLPGIEEGELLTGESDYEEIAKYFLQGSASLVVVKLGKEGAYYATNEQTGIVQGEKVEHVVDPIGAGDGFAAGLISGLLREWSLEESVHLANRVAAFALTVPGDAEGYPYEYQINPDYVQVQR